MSSAAPKIHPDFSALTKEEKLKRLEALREKKRRARRAKPHYTPNAGQIKVHLSRKKARFVFAGNGGGKSLLAVQEAMWAAQGYDPVNKVHTPVPATVVVVLDHPDKVEEVWLPKMREWFDIIEDNLKKNGKPYVNQYDLVNGSKLKFMFHQQDQMTFESIEADFIVFDEPCPRNIYVSLRRAGRKKGRIARYLLIGTPISAAWLRTEVYDKWLRGELPDHECFRYGTEVNRINLSKGYIEEFSGVLSEKERRIRLDGEFFDSEGLALAHLFKKSQHVVARPVFERIFQPAAFPCVVAIDPHPSKNHVAVLLGVDKDNRLYYIKELSAKLVARSFARELKRWYNGYRVIDIICDSLGSADSTGGEGFKSFIQVLNEEGVRTRATTYQDKSDEDFIDRIRSVLVIPDKPDNFGMYVPQLRIVEGNDGIIRDVENVGWLKHKDIDQAKDKLDIRQCDFLACLKYALASNLYFKKDKEKPFTPNNNLYGLGKPKRMELLRRRYADSKWEDSEEDGW